MVDRSVPPAAESLAASGRLAAPARAEEGPGSLPGDLELQGGLDVPARLELPAGLVGFPGLRRFEVRSLPGGGLVELASLDERGFTVLGVPLLAVAPERLERLSELGLVEAGETVVVLLAAHGEPPVVTANLAGPIVVGPDGRGRQLVVEDPDFPLRAPVGRP
jgi:hypothetical protein